MFIEDGNPSTLNGMINWKKRDLLIETIMKLQQYQNTAYNLEILEPIYTLLRELPFIEDSLLYEISIFLEPRTSRDKKDKDKEKDKKEKKEKKEKN